MIWSLGKNSLFYNEILQIIKEKLQFKKCEASSYQTTSSHTPKTGKNLNDTSVRIIMLHCLEFSQPDEIT
jgi:hypothetical protein